MGEERQVPEPAPQGDSLAGTALDGRYWVHKELGVGGMATVWLAQDTKLGMQVVIKVPLPALSADVAFRDGFQKEVRSLIQHEHAHIVRILDEGKLEDGRPYAVLQYLAGGSLTDRLQEANEHRQTPAQVLAWLPAVAEALDFVHERDVVHRDVKPGNILFDEHDHVYLADFGIAKAMKPDSRVRDTRTNRLVGTPAYMAPEILSDRDLGGEYDQYGLATVVYEALTGRLPIEAKSAPRQLSDKNERDPTNVGVLLPILKRDAAAAVMRGLDRDPDRRFESCSAFAQAIRSAYDRPPQRRKALLVTIAALSAVLGGLVANYVATKGLPWRSAERPTPLAAAIDQGNAHLKSRENALARADFERALGIDPRSLGALTGRRAAIGSGIDAALARGDYDAAAQAAKEVRGDASLSDAVRRADAALFARLDRGFTVDPPSRIETAVPDVRLSGRVPDIDGVGVRVAGAREVKVEAGLWTARVQGLENGERKLDVVAFDRHGTEARRPVEISVRVPRPTVTGIDPPAGTAVGKTAVVSGRCSDVATLTVGGTEVPIDAGGAWTAVVRLEAGRTPLDVVARSAAGVEVRQAYWLDGHVTSPVLQGIDVRGGYTGQATVEVSGEVEPADAVVTVQKQAARRTGKAWSAVARLPAEGPNQVEVVARDPYENEAREVRTIWRDTVPPQVTLDPLDSTLRMKSGPFEISGDVEDETPCRVTVLLYAQRIPAEVRGKGWLARVTLKPGRAQLQVEAVDAAQNAGHAELQITVPPDAVDASLTEPPVPKEPESPPELSGLAFLRKNAEGHLEYAVKSDPSVVLVSVPAGEFTMGAVVGDPQAEVDEGRHRMSVPAFLMARTEITFAQFNRFCDAVGARRPTMPPKSGPDYPVVNVSWTAANEYCRWIGLQLPGEVFWERAARGGKDGLVYPWGNEWSPQRAEGPNGYGLYMDTGNVWQWCSDPSGDGYIVRGGSQWALRTQPRAANTSYRGVAPGRADPWIGFRPIAVIGTPGD